MKSILKFSSLFVALGLLVFVSCKEEEPTPAGDPVASFQSAPDESNYLTYNFTDFSQNASSWEWDFDDNGATSTEQNPTHTFSGDGEYTVSLVVTNADGVKSTPFTETLSLTDPNAARRLLTGDVSKTWKLYREGAAMSVGTVDNPGSAWPGFTNDGSRPCLYEQEFTFHFDGTYEFDDKGVFWAEYGVFNGPTGCDANVTPEGCMDVTSGELFNSCNDDVSNWLSGTHEFEYDAVSGELTLIGNGAWIGISKLDVAGGYTQVPIDQVKAKIASITQNDGYDVMLVEFLIGEEYWPIYYANYTTATEPTLVTEVAPPPACDPYDAVAYNELSRTFASDAADQFVQLDTIASGYEIVYGADDPTDAGATKVGMITRVEGNLYQELQFQTTDPGVTAIDFTNITTLSIDVYLPSTNDYENGLTDKVIVGLGATKCPPNWWEDNLEYSEEGVAKDEWVTLTWNIDTPSFVAVPDNGATPNDRNDFDMVYINIGGGGHGTGATFYVRNLIFQ